MVLRLNGNPQIEDLRNHSAETVERLRALLMNGAKARLDSHRKYFYEIENCAQVFYVYVSPVNGKVFLLATWSNSATPAALDMTTHRPCPDLAA